MSCQDKTEGFPPPPPTIVLEFLKRMQSADTNAPLDPPMEMRSLDDEFHYLAMEID